MIFEMCDEPSWLYGRSCLRCGSPVGGVVVGYSHSGQEKHAVQCSSKSCLFSWKFEEGWMMYARFRDDGMVLWVEVPAGCLGAFGEVS